MLSFENSNDGRIEQKEGEKKRKKKKNNVKKLCTEGDDVSEFNSRWNRSMDILGENFYPKICLNAFNGAHKIEGSPWRKSIFL